MNHHHENLNFR